MMLFTVVSNHGEVLFSGECDDPTQIPLTEGQELVQGLRALPEQYFENGAFFQISERPSPHHVFDYAAKQWADPRTLSDTKAEKRKAITARRVSEDQRFEWRGKWFQSDDAAWKQITGVHGWVVARNELPPGFPGQWKAADNTYAPIPDVDAWWSFYGAAIARGATNFSHSEAKKAALELCTTVAEVDLFEPW